MRRASVRRGFNALRIESRQGHFVHVTGDTRACAPIAMFNHGVARSFARPRHAEGVATSAKARGEDLGPVGAIVARSRASVPAREEARRGAGTEEARHERRCARVRRGRRIAERERSGHDRLGRSARHDRRWPFSAERRCLPRNRWGAGLVTGPLGGGALLDCTARPSTRMTQRPRLRKGARTVKTSGGSSTGGAGASPRAADAPGTPTSVEAVSTKPRREARPFDNNGRVRSCWIVDSRRARSSSISSAQQCARSGSGCLGGAVRCVGVAAPRDQFSKE